LFDLDNTLYLATTRMFGQIDHRMGAYIANLLGCDADEARRVQKLYPRSRHHAFRPDALSRGCAARIPSNSSTTST
jgi:FMN phosphatase YigB (HAD superfamily)